MKLGLTPDEVNAVLAQVQATLDKSLASDVAKLSKADDDDKSGPPMDESAPPAMDSAPPAPDMSAAPAPDMSAAPAEAPAPAPEAPMGDEPPADPAAEMGQEVSPEQLESEYSALSDAELSMHYMAAKKALWARQGPGEESSPPGAHDMGDDMATPSDAPPAMKTEMKKEEPKEVKTVPASAHMDDSPPVKEKPFGKSEFEALQVQVEGLTKLVKAVLEIPQRKGITSITQVSQEVPELKLPEKLNPAILSPLLREKISSLSKTDRDLVMQVYDGKVSAQKIAHLLK